MNIMAVMRLLNPILRSSLRPFYSEDLILAVYLHTMLRIKRERVGFDVVASLSLVFLLSLDFVLTFS